MGYELYNETSFNHEKQILLQLRIWPLILHLAENYGWKPAGTVWGYLDKPENVVWDGNYWSNDFQMVTEDDAANLGEALESAIKDMHYANLTKKTPKLEYEKWYSTIDDAFNDNDYSNEKLFIYLDRYIFAIQNIINMCKEGHFYIS